MNRGGVSLEEIAGLTYHDMLARAVSMRFCSDDESFTALSVFGREAWTAGLRSLVGHMHQYA